MSDRRLGALTLREQFETWLRTQHPDGRYFWCDGCNCACARFAQATGRAKEWRAAIGRYNINLPMGKWGPLNSAARLEPWTFGALLARLGKQ